MFVTSCDDNKFISEYYTEDVTVDVTNGLWSIERLEECYYSFQGEHNETGAYCNTDYILTNPNGSATIYTVCKYQDCDTVRYVNYDSDGKSITLQYQDGTNETWNFGSIHAVGTGGSADLDYYMLYQKGKTKKESRCISYTE